MTQTRVCPHGVDLGRFCSLCDAEEHVAVFGSRSDAPRFASSSDMSIPELGYEDPRYSVESLELTVSGPESRKKAALSSAAGWAQAGYEAIREAMRELRVVAPELYRRSRKDDDVLERARLFAEAVSDEADRYDPEKERDAVS